MEITTHQRHHTLFIPNRCNMEWTCIHSACHPQNTCPHRIWTSIHCTGHQVDSRSMRIPSETHLAQGNPGRKLCRLASPFNWKCFKILSRNRGNTKSPSEPIQKKCTPHQTQRDSTPNNTLWGKLARSIYVKVYEVKNKTSSDQTGRFHFNSQRGYKYIMVLVKADTNINLVTPPKDRTEN